MSINVKIKWSGKCFDYELPQDAKIKELKAKIEAETNVLSERQKLGLRNKKKFYKYISEKQLPRPIESSSVLKEMMMIPYWALSKKENLS